MLLKKREDDPSKRIEVSVKDLQEELGLPVERAERILEEIRSLAKGVSVPGAIRLGEPYYKQQLGTHVDLKEAIAKRVVGLVPAGITLAASAGTTVHRCVQGLLKAGRYLRIVTNSLAQVDDFPPDPVPGLEFSGGVYLPDVHAFAGDRAIAAFSKRRFPYALVGVSGLAGDTGELFVRNPHELHVVHEIVTSATDTVLVVADAYKLGRTDQWHFASIKQLLQDPARTNLKVHLITNPVERVEGKKERERAKSVYDALVQLGKQFDGRLIIEGV